MELPEAVKIELSKDAVKNAEIAKKLRDTADKIIDESSDPIVLGTELMQLLNDLGRYTEWFFGLDAIPTEQAELESFTCLK